VRSSSWEDNIKMDLKEIIGYGLDSSGSQLWPVLRVHTMYKRRGISGPAERMLLSDNCCRHVECHS
jgi:hypothetical protein